VFEITPKEQLLKNIRKGLVQPLSNKYPLLNFEKDIIRKPLFLDDESFVRSWVEKGYNFTTYSGVYDLFNQLSGIQETSVLGVPAIDEKQLIDLFTENSIPFLTLEKPGKTILCSFAKLENTTDSVCFSSEIQPVKTFDDADYLILFGKASQIENPSNNRFFSEILLKNDLRIQLHIDYFKRFKSVFLFIEE
jgi:hypothetical protein